MNLTPGLHYGIPASAYHADPAPEPSLSSGVARKLLAESPAHAWLAHPKLGGGVNASTESMGLGSMVHSLMDENPERDWVLGPFDHYKTGEARSWKEAVTRAGKTPLLQRDLDEAQPIADALNAKVKLPPSKSEVTAIWKEGDVWCRARYDRLVLSAAGAEVFDWKTSSNDLSDRGIVRSIVKYGYHIQVAFYLRGLAACTGIELDRLSFTLVFVATKAPYTVRRVRLTDLFLAEGQRQAWKAITQWGECLKSDDWGDPRESAVFEADMPLWMDDAEIEIT